MSIVGIIAGAVLNSLWQSAILVFLLWAALRFAPARVNAATRHVIWWIALAAILALPGLPDWTHADRRAAVPQSAAPLPSTTLPVHVVPPFVPEPPAPVTISRRQTAIWPFCVGLWAAVFVFRIGRIVSSYLYLRGVKHRAWPISRPLPGVKRARLLLSSEIASPMAAGFFHPAVLLPEALWAELASGERNCVVLHEAAHLARYDDWTNLAGRVLGAATALHPVAWWVLRQIEREREIACDDWVVAHTGEVESYVESLMRIVQLRTAPDDSVLASGIFGRRSRLGARIELLLQLGREFSPIAARHTVGTAAVGLAVLAAASVMAPRWIVFAQRLQFEVVSIKRNNVKDMRFDAQPRRSGDLVMMHNIQMWTMLAYAYRIRNAYQVIGYKDFPDDWRWYDMDARIGRDATDDEVRLMMQSMLEDRFQLKVHRETREMPEYQLVPGKGKPKLGQPADGPTLTVTIEDRQVRTREGTCGGTLWNDGTHVICHAATIDKLIPNLSSELQAPVADGTGLTGTYDLHMHYAPEKRRLNPRLELEPTLEQALGEQLGLKLEKGKGTVEILVIDHMEKPSEN